MKEHKEYTTREARNALADIINSAAYGQERIILARRGKKLAAVVSMEDLALLERMEDQQDLEAAEKALNDPANQKRVPWSEVKKALNL